jgi:hypothetical protein
VPKIAPPQPVKSGENCIFVMASPVIDGKGACQFRPELFYCTVSETDVVCCIPLELPLTVML